MKKIQRAFVIVLASILLLLVGTGGSLVAFAEEVQEPPAVTEETETDIDCIAEQFVNYLKDKYGADYQLYYNDIIEQWGSIEGYLLAFGNKLPEQYQTGWDKFVGWLKEYSVIWAPVLAVVILIIAVIVGKKKFKKIKEWFTALVEKLVNKRLAPIEKELNLQSNAIISQMRAQKALMGTADKFSDNVKELEEAEKELTDG